MTAGKLGYRPTDLPELRAEIVEKYSEQTIRRIQPALVETVARTQDVARRATLFHVAEPMVDLALAAGKSLPNFTVDDHDIPCAQGFVYFDKPLWVLPVDNQNIARGVVAAIGVLWDKLPGQPIGVSWITERDALNMHPTVVAVLPRLIPIHAGMWGSIETAEAVKDLISAVSEPMLRALWLLMEQRVAMVEDAHLDRTTRKRLARKGLDADRIRVISLRRAWRSSSAESPDREYLHQWIVKGHWRQHWYPARQVHRPLWIAPHVKGPEGAPMLGGEKVYHLKR